MITFSCDKCDFKIFIEGTIIKSNDGLIVRADEKEIEKVRLALPGAPFSDKKKIFCVECTKKYGDIVQNIEEKKKKEIDDWLKTKEVNHDS